MTKGQLHLGNVAHKVKLGLLHAQGRDDVRNIRQRKGRRQLHRPAVTPAPEPSPTATTADLIDWCSGLNTHPIAPHKICDFDGIMHHPLRSWRLNRCRYRFHPVTEEDYHLFNERDIPRRYLNILCNLRTAPH